MLFQALRLHPFRSAPHVWRFPKHAKKNSEMPTTDPGPSPDRLIGTCGRIHAIGHIRLVRGGGPLCEVSTAASDYWNARDDFFAGQYRSSLTFISDQA